MQKILFSLLSSIGLVTSANGAAIAINALEGAGFATSFGSNAVDDLAAGNLIRVGYFNISDAFITANAFNLSYLNSNFVEFGTSRIGEGLGGISGHLVGSDISVPNSDALGFENKQIYLWVFASNDNSSVSSSLSTAYEHGIFTLGGVDAWTFPGHNDNPNNTVIDINNLVAPSGTSLLPGAKVLVGSFPKGTSQATGASNFALAVVPEPSTAVAALLGGSALLLRRRRRN